MRDAFKKALTELIESDEKVVLITGDLGFGVFEDIQERFPKQFLNVGVAEQNMTAIAAGMALEGFTVFTYSIGNFPTFRCLEQIRNDASYHDANINIVCTGGGFSYGALGMSHHATEDLSVMRAIPGVTSVIPSSAWESYEATKAIASTPGVGYLRIEKTKSDEVTSDDTFEIGKARRLREGNHLTILASGGIANEALKAADEIKNEKGLECRVVSMHSLKPIDKEEILSACTETGGIITLEENNIIGGLGGAVSEVCMEEGTFPKKFKRIGMDDCFTSVVGSQAYLREYYQMDSGAIIRTILEW